MTVHLVGAGPGDPGLLTVRARELLRQADCVVHDALVSDAILAQAHPGAVRHFVGKRGGGHSATQEAINALLVSCGRAHRCVVRLKGGDPFVFGRGGEEAVALAEAGIPFQIVPGITAGIAVPAYAGIPITHRAASSSVAFVTGHEARDGGDGPVDWTQLVRVETIVLYMGMHKLAASCAALIAAGRNPDDPAAVIQWGTQPRQRTVTATLATIDATAKAAGLGAPAITVIGPVVRYRERIRWFDTIAQRPLFGRTALVTRARDGENRLGRLLADQGAEVIDLPLARYEPARDPAPLDAALADCAGAWIALTSANAVAFLWERLRRSGGDSRRLAGARIAAVGPGTAAALERIGLRADLVPPDGGDGAALGRALLAAGCTRAILPQAENARPELAATLREGGAAVTAATAYRAVEEPVPADVPWERVDLVPLASAATMDRLAAAAGPHLAAMAARGCRFVAIGPVTAQAIARHGLPVAASAARSSIDALAEACTHAIRE